MRPKLDFGTNIVPIIGSNILKNSQVTPVHLHGLATVVPANKLPQDMVLIQARKILGPRYSQFERLASTFENSGVENRYSVVPMDWFEEPKNWPERNQEYLKGALALWIDAATKALKESGWTADQVDVVLTISSTGIATPTLEALAFKQMGFSSTVRRVPVFGLGCAGGVTGLGQACEFARAQAGCRVLVVAVETCSLSFRSDRLQKADIIATVLFGDGAAAACVSTSAVDETASSVCFGSGVEHTWVDTLDIMGWDVDEQGLGVVFDRSIPAFADTHFREAANIALAKSNLKIEEIDRFVCHPGGAKVVSALEGALDLPANSLDEERNVLRDVGNMSAPTALFVLDRVRKGETSGQMMLTALGPGFTASFLPMTKGPVT